MKVNEELRRLEYLNNRKEDYLLERTFAAMTNAFLTQKEQLQNSLQGLINWSAEKEIQLTPQSLFEKIQQLFNKDSEYQKFSDDLLQITCGRRADLINSRRESLLKHIPDEFIATSLRKIPPNSEHLFDSRYLNDYLRTIGGAEKLLSTPIATTSATALRPSNAGTNRSININEYISTASTSK